MGNDQSEVRALVTGGGGFLGKAIVEQLIDRGVQVRSFSRSDYPKLRDMGVEHIQGDIADARAVSEAVDGCQIVYHTAAKAGVWGSYEEYFRPNVMGTENIIDACRVHDVPRLVYTSSPSVVYGDQPLRGVDESVRYPDEYLTAYPETKAIAEKKVLKANCQALRTAALRPHLIWGPGDNHLVPRIVDRARRGKLKKIGGGEAVVDSVYIDDAARAHLLAADALDDGVACGKVYFITQGDPREVGELIDRIVDAAGVAPVESDVPAKVAYGVGWLMETLYKLLRKDEEPLMTRFVAKQLSTDHYFDISAARDDLGYEPQTTIDEGMRRLGEWIEREGL